MTPSSDDGDAMPQTFSSRIRTALLGPPGAAGTEGPDPAVEVIPVEQRKDIMRSLDPMERRLAQWALILAAVAGLAAAIYITTQNKVTKTGKNSIAVAPDAWLLAGVILALCVIGGLALWKRKRTFVTFDLFLIGFAFTLPFGLIGFVFILLGGWFMLRAWRISRYGTTNTKLIAKEAASRRSGGRDRTSGGRTSSKTSTTPAARKPPTASKRYTPKKPPRKKIPKPTE